MSFKNIKATENVAYKKLSVVFRVLRDDETTEAVLSNGLIAKDVNSNISALDHVRSGKRMSAWISTTASFFVALLWAVKSGCRIAVIDFSKLNTEIIDLRNGNSDLEKRFSNYAKSSREMLIKGFVPSEAIIKVISLEKVLEALTQNCDERTIIRPITLLDNMRYWDLKDQEKFLVDTVKKLEFLAGNGIENWLDSQKVNHIFHVTQEIFTSNRIFKGLIPDVDF